MRQQLPFLRHLVLLFALGLATGATGTVAADSRTEARSHYQAGVKFYSGGDYKSAIREFSAAQQLAPADLNNYNLALCYDKLGDPEPAIQYYRSYLDKVPTTDKRAEIEASIARLEAASKSVAAKKAAEAKKLEDARLAAEAKQAAEQARIDEARRAEEAKRPIVEPPRPDDVRRPGDGTLTGVGSTGTPGNGTTVTTGDAQLDRVSGIDINQIRDQRVGGAASGIPADPSAAPAAGAGAHAQLGTGPH
nr:hypothetical protein [Myxococcota bacterium]